MNRSFLNIILFSNLLIAIFVISNLESSIAEQNINIIADKIISDQSGTKITATGDAIITNTDGTKIKANKIVYNDENSTATATNSVIISDIHGNSYFLDQLETSDGFNKLKGHNVKSRLNDGSRIVSASIYKNNEITVLNDAEYTPCKESEYLIKNCPGWKLKSNRIYQDTSKETVYYDHAKLYLFNLPILYLPYFSHPDPSVNKRSGFLMPTIQTDNNLGEKFSIPYFFDIAGNKDLTFTPNIQSKSNNFYTLDYRHLNKYGRFNVESSIDDNDDNEGTKNHIFIDANLNNAYGELTASIKTSNNDTYLRKNKINQLTVHESGVKFLRDRKDSKFSVVASSYKYLTIENTNQWEYIYPKIEFNLKNIKLKKIKGKLSIDNDFSYRQKLDKSNLLLAASQISWNDRNIHRGTGLIIDNKADFRTVTIAIDNKSSADLENVRFYPQFSSKVTYPLYKKTGVFSHTLTPIFMPIIAPYNNYTGHKKITNSNLFSINRAPSIIESESGPRMNYGIEWFIENQTNLDIKFTVGQSIRINKEKSDNSEEISDYYISTNFVLDDNKYFNNSLIFDRDNRDIKTNNVNLLLALDNFSLGIDYDYNSGKYFTASEQLRLGTKFNFANNFEFNLNAAKNIDTNKNIGYQYGLLYENDCIGIDLNYYRDLTKDRDVEESYGYSFTIVLKPFGTTKKYGEKKVFGPKV